MHIKKLNKTYIGVILLIATILLLSIPLIRVYQNNPAIPSGEHYQLLTHPHPVLAFFLNHIPQSILSLFFPLLFALTTLLCFTYFVQKYARHEQETLYALVIVLFTPAFLLTFIGLNEYALTVALLMIFAVLFDKRNKWYYFVIATLFFANAFIASLVLLTSIVYSLVIKQKQQALVHALFLVVSLVLVYSTPLLNIHIPHLSFSINSLFAFFGGNYGYSLFLLFLGIMGFFLSKERLVPLIVFGLGFVIIPFRLIAILMLCFYAGKYFYYLQDKKWSIDGLKELTLLLFACILLFSTTTFLKEQINEQPLQEHLDAFTFIRKQNFPATILTSESLEPFATYATGLLTLSTKELFLSQQYNFIQREFKKEDISFIVIDSNMKNGDIWQRDEEGLLFLIKYNDNFRLIYKTGDVEVYRFTGWN